MVIAAEEINKNDASVTIVTECQIGVGKIISRGGFWRSGSRNSSEFHSKTDDYMPSLR
jgi:hypothetical protein